MLVLLKHNIQESKKSEEHKNTAVQQQKSAGTIALKEDTKIIAKYNFISDTIPITIEIYKKK